MEKKHSPYLPDAARRELDDLLARAGFTVAACDTDGRLTMFRAANGSTWVETQLPEVEIHNGTQLFDADGTVPLRAEDLPLLRALNGEHVLNAVLTARPDGERLVHFRCCASPITDDDGHSLGAVAITQDITAEVQANRDADVIRTRLVETINHEFRTPLSHVLGHAELLADMANTLPPYARKSAHAVHAGAVLMRDLLEVLSGLTDTAGHLRLQPTHGDLVAVVRIVENDWRPILERRQIDLDVQSPDRLTATFDPAEIHRAMTELLANAAVYAPDSSSVTLTLTCANGEVVLAIADHGPGIPEKDRERLLQPFERGAPHPLEPVNARGLGLAVASTIAHAHGGSLTLGDNRPNGLRAILRLPGTGCTPRDPSTQGPTPTAGTG